MAVNITCTRLESKEMLYDPSMLLDDPDFQDYLSRAMLHKSGRALYLLECAGMLNTLIVNPEFCGHDFKRNLLSIHYGLDLRINQKAVAAWNNFTGGREFDGSIEEFAQALYDYAVLSARFAMTYTQADPILSPGRIWEAAYVGGPAQILKLAATPDWQYWRMNYDALGYDSALEAFEAGVPMDDILV